MHPFLFFCNRDDDPEEVNHETNCDRERRPNDRIRDYPDQTDLTIGSIQHILMITRGTIMAQIMTDIMDTITIKAHTMKNIVMVMVMEETMEEDRIRGGILDKNGMLNSTTFLELITTVLEMTTRTQEDEEQDLIGEMHLTLIADRVTGLKQLILNHDKPLSLELFKFSLKTEMPLMRIGNATSVGILVGQPKLLKVIKINSNRDIVKVIMPL